MWRGAVRSLPDRPSCSATYAAGSLGAWTVVTIHQPDVLPNLLEVCPRVLVQFARDIDLLRQIVLRMVATLRQIVPEQHLGRYVLPLLQGLDEERRTKALEIFLTAR